jgi:hypothetical protein
MAINRLKHSSGSMSQLGHSRRFWHVRAGDVEAGVGPAAGTERIAAADKTQLHRSLLQPTSTTAKLRE